ncbi:MAG: hypothetical protein KAT00_04125, partial [Planctomycetes bacterium]|nr:hypothetical protein [Planctomycetota bacterium]
MKIRSMVTLMFFSVVVCLGGSVFGLTVSVITDQPPGLGAEHGLRKIIEALDEKGVTIEYAGSVDDASGSIKVVMGVASGGGVAAALLKEHRIELPDSPEALVIARLKEGSTDILLISGTDDRGLMYAELDVADRIGWAQDDDMPFGRVRNIMEEPDAPERALATYTMHREYVESFLYDEDYWASYLDMLAENRFNSFVFILGYSPATWLAPSYPYFFDVEGFPQIKFEGLTKQQQRRNLKALNRIIDMTHERGMDFTLGIWDHLPRHNSEYKLPVGIDEDNVISYTEAALAKLLKVVPDLDALQFRMHWESGLSRDEQVLLDFWGGVFETIKNSDRDIGVYLRAKGLPDSVIQKAVDSGIRFRITTKYWAEQLGMPFHPGHINRRNQHDRRHQYADLLKYPKQYEMHWKVWNGGTAKFLLWGDPEYVRRFTESTHLYGGQGFEIKPMLATKMAMHPKEKPFDLMGRRYEYYDYEFERYWHFLQVFGRVSYNPQTSSEIWEEEFKQRFGDEAGPYVQKAIHRASQVLPRIIAYAMTQFPTMSGFAEKQSGGRLEQYAKTRPSDIQTFLGMDEAAEFLLEGKESAKTWPQQTSKWFQETSADILGLVKEAERRIGDDRNKEFESTMVDMRILAYLALYHGQRVPAGINYLLYEETGDLAALNRAIRHEGKAIDAYEKIVESAGDVYANDLMMGRSEPPHWRDELALLKGWLKELKKLQREKQAKGARPKRKAPDISAYRQDSADSEAPSLKHEAITSTKPNRPLTIT